jgi:hypothetical protein
MVVLVTARLKKTLAGGRGLAVAAAAVVVVGAAGSAGVATSDGEALLRPAAWRFPATASQKPEMSRAERKRQRREKLRRAERRRFAHLPGGVSRSTLDAIAACESGGDPAAIGGGGAYRGKYQFDYGTWAGVGGHGDPAAASEREQDYRAALLYSRSGSSPWPVCGA